MLITASEFASKYHAKNRDIKIVKKVYGNKEKTEDEWFSILSGKIVFDESEFQKKKKIREVKERKKKTTSKKEASESKKEESKEEDNKK